MLVKGDMDKQEFLSKNTNKPASNGSKIATASKSARVHIHVTFHLESDFPY